MQPGLALQSARSTANVHVRNRADGNMAAPGTIWRLPPSASSRTGLAANGLAPGAASLSALSTPEYAKRVACRATKFLYRIVGCSVSTFPFRLAPQENRSAVAALTACALRFCTEFYLLYRPRVWHNPT